MTKNGKISSVAIAIQKSITSFDLHGLMRPGLLMVTYVHPPLVHYKRRFSMEFFNWEHAVCPLSGIKKRPLVGGFLYTSTVGVLYREVVCWWEGLLWEVSWCYH